MRHLATTLLAILAATPVPAGDLADIHYGRRLVNETFALIGPEVADESMRYAGNNLACRAATSKAAGSTAASPSSESRPSTPGRSPAAEPNRSRTG